MAEGAGAFHITVLGSGTSTGVPTIGCDCKVCTSPDPRDQRLRPSIFIRHEGRGVLIDTTPDFRTQALRAGIKRIDAILFTHAHADHIMGLDDVRPFNFRQKGPIPLYGSREAFETITRAFCYVFDGRETESSRPKLEPIEIADEPFEAAGIEFTPILLHHGKGSAYGFRFGSAAYLTDHSDIPPQSAAKLANLDVLFLDALRYKPHPTHSTVQRSLEWVSRLQPRRAFFTHICHDLLHARAEQMLPDNVRLAYDGLEIDVEPVR